LAVTRKELIPGPGGGSVESSQFFDTKHGFLTKKQSRILFLRARGFTQTEIGREMKLSRASVSMIEYRARRQILKARQTLQYFDAVQRQYEVKVLPGTRLQQIPMVVLQEADKNGIHLRSNMVEILRMVKKDKGFCLGLDGRLIDPLLFRFNEKGKVSLI
jgi:HTH-type transcriptional regulator, fmd operon transcriptional regulator